MSKKNKDQLDLFEQEKAIEVEKPRYAVKYAMEMLRPPFTDEQVLNLNRFQMVDCLSPYTCLVCYNVKLIANNNGLACPSCSYTQDWALAIAFDLEAIERGENWSKRPKPDLDKWKII